MKYRVAIIKHSSIDYDITGLLKDWRAWERVVFGNRTKRQREELEILFVGDTYDPDHWEEASGRVAWYENAHPLEWKSFGMFQDTMSKEEWWGLTTPQEWIKEDVPLLKAGLVDCVIFMYKKPRHMDSKVTSWTRFGTFYEDTDFIEIAMPDWDDQKKVLDEGMRYLTHEIRHALVRRAHRRKLKVTDVMDKTPTASGWKPYYKEFDIEAEDGNRAVQDRFLLPHWSTIEKPLPTPVNPTTLHWIINMLRLVMPVEKKSEPITLSTVSLWADAIQKHEGWAVGSCSYRCNNPGNLRYIGQKTAIGVCECGTSGEFCLFPDYKTGRKALETMLYNAATGESTVYRPEMSILEFFTTYAPPSDNNNSEAYAKAVVEHLRNNGVDVTINTPISRLV